jgi:hypothetical protein
MQNHIALAMNHIVLNIVLKNFISLYSFKKFYKTVLSFGVMIVPELSGMSSHEGQ